VTEFLFTDEGLDRAVGVRRVLALPVREIQHVMSLRFHLYRATLYGFDAGG
jgi:hypothetical protein